MEYQSISDPAQLQLLEGVMRMLLHGVLAAIVVASAVLLWLYLSELRFPRRRPSEVEGPGWIRSQQRLLAARRGASLDRLTTIRLWDTAADLSGGCLSADTTPALWLGQSERGHRWGETAEAH
jgi:hypothetical protein